ncbi:MAG: efflux RND transporter periplasmic adaptor subunit [Chthoniobacterales bacterium]|nr:efflux RND transporter periplasmic adaptor subunit [Chthoniobacterales bacterium]
MISQTRRVGAADLPNDHEPHAARVVDVRPASVDATRKPMKRIIPILFGLALVILAVWFVRRQGGGSETYRTAPVTRGALTQAVTATGTLNPVVNVQVGSQISGNVSKLSVDYNSSVKAGQVVAEIDPAIFKAAVTQAQGDLENAQAGLELAQINQKRMVDLVQKQTTSQSELDQANATLHQAQANVMIKQGALDRAKTDLDHCTITSPIDGTVISRSVDVGQTVAASLSAPIIFTIANDLTKMQIDTNVAEADVGVIEQDQNVDFTVDAFPNRTFHGTVVQVRNAPTTVQNVVSYDTVIGVTNADLKLKPGMTANVSIIVAQRENVLKVGNAALRFHPPEEATAAPNSDGAAHRPGRGKPAARSSEKTVYVLASDASSPQPMKIKTGISDGIYTEVLEGLKEGDQVVTAAVGKSAEAAATNNPFSGGRRF